MIALGLWLALGGTALAGDCDAPATTMDLNAALTSAEGAFSDLDLDGFRDGWARAQARLPCLVDVLTPFDVAAWHRIEGLDAWLSRDLDAAAAAFRGAAAAQPAYRLPSTIAQPGNALYDLYDEAGRASRAELVRMHVPRGRILVVDGVRAAGRPSGRPAVVQVLSGQGAVLWSGSLGPHDVEPDWSEREAESVAPPPPAVEPAPNLRIRGVREHRLPADRGFNRPLAIGAGAAAVTSVGLYAVALSFRSTYDHPDTPYDQLASLRSRTNASVLGSAGAGAVAVGLGIAAVSVRW